MTLRFHLFIGSLVVASSAQAADSRIDNPMDEVNEHFAIASEYFGDGQAQLHSRRDGADGSAHTVYTFDCVEQTYHTAFEGPDAPADFPFTPLDEAMEPLKRDSAVIPLARHVCAEHDHPLIELKW